MEKFSNNLNLKDATKMFVIALNESQNLGELQDLVHSLKSKKKGLYEFGEVTKVYPIGFSNILFIGLGKKEKYSLLDIQTLAAKIIKSSDENIIINMDSFSCLSEDKNYLMEKMVETILLVQYKFNDYKTTKVENKEINVEFYSEDDLIEAFENGKINAFATNNARTLVNEPRNKITPITLAEYAKNLSEELKIDYKIYNKTEIEQLGMGAFLAVNQGSKDEAKLIHIKYRGNKQNEEITALVGKGLTYDSGGYSLKPKNGMAGMKSDMGGAASVLGAIEIIARKKLNVNVDVIIAATENLINSEAMVPDDVIVAMNGKTIEVTNTDAEGRLTLVDAVTYAKKNKATKIIDVATLTGGIITALGTNITGAFTNDKDLLERVKKASDYTGEAIWEMPVDPFRKRCRESQVADYNNSPGRDGHASYGAAIIAEFAEDTPWVHLDIAGTSTKKAAHLLGPTGATGVMVRTLANLFE